MNNTKMRIAVAVMSILLIFIGIILYQGVSGNLFNKDVFNNCKTFSTLDDFAFLTEYANETKYDKEQAGGVTPLNQVRYEVTYEKVNYTVYAYEFANKADCYKYAKELTGTDVTSLEEQLRQSEFTLFNSIDLVIYMRVDGYVITETKILHVAANTNKKTYKKFLQFLFANLPTEVAPKAQP